MKREAVLVQKLSEISNDSFDMVMYAQEMRMLNQGYVQSAMQAVGRSAAEDLADMLQSNRKLRKTIAGLQKTDKEMLVYECGIFVGANKVVEEISRIYMDQEERRNSLKLLERRYVREILDYLYANPDARHGEIAEAVKVSPNYLSEILNLLIHADYVERYGKNKGTRYCLTRAGRQNCRVEGGRKEEGHIWIDTDYREILDKKKFMEGRSGGDGMINPGKEDGYAEWKKHFRVDAETAGS